MKDVTEEQRDFLYKYYESQFGGFSDDPDIEREKATEWLNGLSEELMKLILNKQNGTR